MVPTAGEKRQFEPWVFARLYFDDGESGHFFRLLRSAMSPGKVVAEIATRQPNDDPGQAFLYRFRLQQGTRVSKTHITFPLHDALLQRIEELFFGSEPHPPLWNLHNLLPA